MRVTNYRAGGDAEEKNAQERHAFPHIAIRTAKRPLGGLGIPQPCRQSHETHVIVSFPHCSFFVDDGMVDGFFSCRYGIGIGTNCQGTIHLNRINRGNFVSVRNV